MMRARADAKVGVSGAGSRHEAVDGAPIPGEPKVYVVLVCWKGWKDTSECLESLLRSDYSNFTVIVCDNRSPDASVDNLRKWASGDLMVGGDTGYLSWLTSRPVPKPIPLVELTREDAEGAAQAEGDPRLIMIHSGGNLGFAGGNNVALRYLLARGDAAYVWLLNTDTLVDPEALRRMIEVVESDPSVGMVGSKVLDYAQPDRVQAAAGGSLIPWQGRAEHFGRDEKDEGQWDEPFEPDFITGASLLARFDTVGSIGLLDERYFLYAEEVDWCLRARRAGWRLVYCPDSRVWHKGGSSVGYKGAFHDYHSVRSALLLIQKFYPYHLPWAVLYSLYRSVLPKVLRLQARRLGAVCRAYRDFVTGSVTWGGPGSDTSS